jgi:glycosyltransferase involved in cell wall biosynthesis
LLKRAIASVLNQTYQDFEVIVVDDGLEKRAEQIIQGINDSRIKYTQHKESLGGSAARNTGIRNAQGEYIAFLDDDDEWLPEKLEKQMRIFFNDKEIGFCFSAVNCIYNQNRKERSYIKEGKNDYFEIALKKFKGFLTSTLIVKKNLLEDLKGFDITLPSHQEVDLIIRLSKNSKGYGINFPLVNMCQLNKHKHIGSDFKKRIEGRKMILSKHEAYFNKRPKLYAIHLFDLGTWLRKEKQYSEARKYFKKALSKNFKTQYLLHYLILIFNGKFYALLKRL